MPTGVSEPSPCVPAYARPAVWSTVSKRFHRLPLRSRAPKKEAPACVRVLPCALKLPTRTGPYGVRSAPKTAFAPVGVGYSSSAPRGRCALAVAGAASAIVPPLPLMAPLVADHVTLVSLALVTVTLNERGSLTGIVAYPRFDAYRHGVALERCRHHSGHVRSRLVARSLQYVQVAADVRGVRWWFRYLLQAAGARDLEVGSWGSEPSKRRVKDKLGRSRGRCRH